MISEDRFNDATEVVSAGIAVATAMFELPKEERPQALEAHAILMDGLRGDDLTIGGLLDLLGVALMITAYERVSGRRFDA